MPDKLLVTLNTNWADEMDITGFFVCTQESWEEFKKEAYDLIKSCEEENSELEVCVGSNQYIKFSSKKDFDRAYSVTRISAEEELVLAKFFKDSYSKKIKFGFELDFSS